MTCYSLGIETITGGISNDVPQATNSGCQHNAHSYVYCSLKHTQTEGHTSMRSSEFCILF